VSFRRRTNTVSALATSNGHKAGTSSMAPLAMASNIAAVWDVACAGCTQPMATEASATKARVTTCPRRWQIERPGSTAWLSISDGSVAATHEDLPRHGEHHRTAGHLPALNAPRACHDG